MVAASLQIAIAFNLVCTGTVKTGALDLALMGRQGTEPFTITYRVDLGSGRYCVGECASTRYLHSFNQTEINFRITPFGNGPVSSSANVNRETGLYTEMLIIGDQATIWQGSCERSPFTGFPSRRF